MRPWAPARYLLLRGKTTDDGGTGSSALGLAGSLLSLHLSPYSAASPSETSPFGHLDLFGCFALGSLRHGSNSSNARDATGPSATLDGMVTRSCGSVFIADLRSGASRILRKHRSANKAGHRMNNTRVRLRFGWAERLLIGDLHVSGHRACPKTGTL